MPINRVIIEEPPRLFVHLPWRQMVPHVHQFLEHVPGPAFVDFAEAAEDAEFSVGHTHVDFVCLGVGGTDGLQFGGWGGGKEGGEDG